MTKEAKAYYDLMMNNIPSGVSVEDWEKEIISDIECPEEIIDRKSDVKRFASLLEVFEERQRT